MRIRYVAPGLLALLTFGCDSLIGPGVREDVVIGVIDQYEGESPAVALPDTVQAGAEFTVTFHTVWPNGCARRHRTEAQVDGASATITPYDVVRKHAMCTQAPVQITHTVTLRFSEPGTAQVSLRGRGGFDDSSLVTILRDVTVE